MVLAQEQASRLVEQNTRPGTAQLSTKHTRSRWRLKSAGKLGVLGSLLGPLVNQLGENGASFLIHTTREKKESTQC